MDLMKYTAVALGKKIKAGEVTVKEAAQAALDQIKKSEETLNSYVTVLEENDIFARAEEVQKQIDAGELTGPLAGVPVAIKDNMCTKGVLTTCSSKRPIWMNLRWEVRRRHPHTELRETHTIQTTYRAVLRAVPV